MKQAIRSKETALVLLLILSATLTGALLFKPELINASEPFIDLNSGVGQAIGNAKDAYSAINISSPLEAQPPVPASSEVSMPDHTAVDGNFGDYSVRIVVEGESVTKQESGSNRRTEMDIKDLLNEIRSTSGSILLVDDYADAKVFTRIIQTLDTQGIPFDKERMP